MTVTATHRDARGDPDGWTVASAAARAVAGSFDRARPGCFALEGQELRGAARDDPHALLAWRPGHGWESLLPAADPRAALLELYLPICSAHAGRPIAVGHLGQSLDGFIATRSGESHYVTGPENILHLHRMRALCDAVIVGAGTVAADDPRLTTRLVTGGNPLRVVLDPDCRLEPHHRIFADGEAPTLRVCATGKRRAPADEAISGNGTAGDAHASELLELPRGANGLDLVALLRHLHERGCARVFVEGGGVTVSAFLEAGLLDRVHLAVAPLLIGDGRPAIRLRRPVALPQCLRPPARVYGMGADVLFDCDLRADAAQARSADGVRRLL